jgi:hypothetical protein
MLHRIAAFPASNDVLGVLVLQQALLPAALVVCKKCVDLHPGEVLLVMLTGLKYSGWRGLLRVVSGPLSALLGLERFTAGSMHAHLNAMHTGIAPAA